MKKNIVFVFFLLLCCTSFSQRIVKKEVDKFSGVETIETSSKWLWNSMGAFNGGLDFCIRKVDNTYCMPARILYYDVFKFTEEDGSIVLLLSNKETVTLQSTYTGIASPMSGSDIWVFSTVFRMTEDDVAKLKQYDVTDVRIDFFGGRCDREIKESKRDLIKRMLNLFEE